MALNYTTLSSGSASFHEMIKRFGVVTVMNAKVYDLPEGYKNSWKAMKADEIIMQLKAQTPICELDTLKIANVPQEGPTKTVTGGQYANPLIKYGKTARLEMQDALGNADAIEALCGGLREADDSSFENVDALHFGQDFAKTVAILGETFFINQKDGKQVNAEIIFYQFVPDSLFNLTQDAEGDATVFDMNGDLLCTDIKMSTPDRGTTVHGAFYSIVNPALTEAHVVYFDYNPSTLVVSMPVSGYNATIDGAAIENGDSLQAAASKASLVIVYEGDTQAADKEVYRTVLEGLEKAL